MLPDLKIGNLRVDGSQPFFILGPCVMESEAFIWEIGRALKKIADDLGILFIFKASYDKANRTSIDSFRGMDVSDGCRLLAEVGKKLGVPVTTDVHSPGDVAIAADHIDLLQVPAFLCRQTDLILSAAKSGRAVNVKKGQFLAPGDVGNIAKKLTAGGCEHFVFTERGASFGYNNLVADMRSLYWIREQGYRVIFDATHSVQRPGGQGATSGGDGVLAPVLARAAMAAGCDGIFMETHFDPAKALSDGPNQVPIEALPGVLRQLLAVHRAVSA